MLISFMAQGKKIPPLDYGGFYADPPVHEVTIHVRFGGRAKASMLKPGEIPIPLKDHLATFRRAQFGPDEFVYQLKSKPPEGWSWVVHNGSMKAYRTHVLWKMKE